MKKFIILALAAAPYLVHAQDDLIKKIESNHSYVTTPNAPVKITPAPKSTDANKKYEFNDLIDLEHTGVSFPRYSVRIVYTSKRRKPLYACTEPYHGAMAANATM